MRVLEAPQTWIAAAAVLVLIAVVLIALASRRRRRTADAPDATAGSAASTAGPAAARLPEEDPDTGPVSPGGARDPAAAGDDAVTAPASPSGPVPVTGLAPEAAPDEDAEPARYRRAASEDLFREVRARPRPTPSPRPVAARAAEPHEPAEPLAPHDVDEAPAVPVPDPARAADRAKDRLLAALLPDHRGAVDVLAAMPEQGPPSGAHAAALLRTGLSPTQVAGLCGVEPTDLADLVARELGLLERSRTGAEPTSQDGATDSGASRTDVPGRAWASAGSAAGSTTPTTG